MVTPIEPGPDAICSLDEVKRYIRVNLSDPSEDEFIAELIDESTGQIETFLGRKIKLREDLVELYDGTNTSHIFVRTFPIKEVTEINIDPLQTFNDATSIDVDLNIIVSEDEGRISFIGLSPLGATFPGGNKNIRIKYSGGFDPIPFDLRLACKKLTATHWALAREGGDGILAEALGGRSITWVQGIPKDITEMIKHYRRIP